LDIPKQLKRKLTEGIMPLIYTGYEQGYAAGCAGKPKISKEQFEKSMEKRLSKLPTTKVVGFHQELE